MTVAQRGAGRICGKGTSSGEAERVAVRAREGGGGTESGAEQLSVRRAEQDVVAAAKVGAEWDTVAVTERSSVRAAERVNHNGNADYK